LLPADCFPPGRYRALVRYGVPLRAPKRTTQRVWMVGVMG
jgi:hypothetical protein